jgi:DDE superfamily endonuclease
VTKTQQVKTCSGQLKLSLLGIPEVRLGSRQLAFRTRKVQALLVYLALEPGFHSRDKLIALLWLDADQSKGRGNLHSKSETPNKKPRGGKLTLEQRAENRVLARERIVVEHVNRRFKVFRVLSGVYRNRRSRYGLRVNLVAGVYNLDCVESS